MSLRRSIVLALASLGAVGAAITELAVAEEKVETQTLRIRSQLRTFATLPKFAPTSSYAGAATPMLRVRYEAEVNRLAGRLVALSAVSLSREDVLRELSRTLEQFDDAGAADAEQLFVYLAEMARMVGIQGADRLADTWRYGFDPRQTVAANNAAAVARMSARERDVLALLERAEPESAVAMLTRALGPPTPHGSGTLLWFITEDRRSVASLSTAPGRMSAGLLRQRTFSYVRQLERKAE